jgi:hypothetical protein
VDAGRLAAAGPAVGEIHLDNDIDRHGGDVSDISGWRGQVADAAGVRSTEGDNV